MPVGTRSQNGFYAIRKPNGETGIYEHWYQAVMNGYTQMAGHGNAVKCDTMVIYF